MYVLFTFTALMNIWNPWMEIDDLLTKLALHAYWQNVWHEKWALLRLTICMTQLFLDLTFSQNYIYHTTFVTEWHVNLGEGVVSIRLIYVLMSWMNFTIHIHHTHLIWSLYCVFSSQSKGKVLEVQFFSLEIEVEERASPSVAARTWRRCDKQMCLDQGSRAQHCVWLGCVTRTSLLFFFPLHRNIVSKGVSEIFR